MSKDVVLSLLNSVAFLESKNINVSLTIKKNKGTDIQYVFNEGIVSWKDVTSDKVQIIEELDKISETITELYNERSIFESIHFISSTREHSYSYRNPTIHNKSEKKEEKEKSSFQSGTGYNYFPPFGPKFGSPCGFNTPFTPFGYPPFGFQPFPEITKNSSFTEEQKSFIDNYVDTFIARTAFYDDKGGFQGLLGTEAELFNRAGSLSAQFNLNRELVLEYLINKINQKTEGYTKSSKNKSVRDGDIAQHLDATDNSSSEEPKIDSSNYKHFIPPIVYDAIKSILDDYTNRSTSEISYPDLCKAAIRAYVKDYTLEQIPNAAIDEFIKAHIID